MFSVRDIASGQVRPGGRSAPIGRGGREDIEAPPIGACVPFSGTAGGWYPTGVDCYRLAC